MQDLQQIIPQLIAEHLGVEVARVTAQASFEKDLKADSLDALEILQAIDERFKLRITPEQMEPVETVADLIALVEQQLQRKV